VPLTFSKKKVKTFKPKKHGTIDFPTIQIEEIPIYGILWLVKACHNSQLFSGGQWTATAFAILHMSVVLLSSTRLILSFSLFANHST
jgi:hypothetical protein